jgi:predicted PurR-regulated permease PerM
MTKEKRLEAMLVISTGFLVLYAIKMNPVFLYIALGAGLVAIFVKPLATLIAKGWFKLGELLGLVVSKVVLTIIFFILIIPISFLYNLFNKDTLRLKRSYPSQWTERMHSYEAKDLKNIW